MMIGMTQCLNYKFSYIFQGYIFQFRNIQMKVLGNVIKSTSDKRTYKAIQLTNKLECLIVCDEEAQKSSAALSVGIGSLLDPVETQGLAHYLEHMLFMGTEKFPDENDYMNFIAKNSGSSNAYTSQQQTNFHFEVASSAFIPTLDRFAQFFICPLMLDSSSERQLNAVHSEHSKNLQNDAWRKFQITKYLAKTGHPYGKFSTGDKSTLSSPDLRKMLFDFYNSHYSSNLMKMVVYGRQGVEEMGQLVVKQFSPILNKEYKRYQMTECPFDQKMLKKMVKIAPVKDKRTLEMTWILKDKSEMYKNSPSRYISHILGHQGKGSLLSFLIKEGLANSLSAGGSDSYNCYSEFQVNINLTDKGFEQITDVIQYVLFALSSLRSQEPQKWIFEQIKNISKMKFDFLQKSQGMGYCSRLAKKLHDKSAEEVLYYPYMMEEWKPELISDYLNELTTDNLAVICENKKFQSECDQTEPIYGSKFTTSDLGDLKPKQYKFELPTRNEFIPKDLSVLPLGQLQLPMRLEECSNQNIEAHYKRDHRFSLPKAEVNLRFYFDGQSTVKEDVCRMLFEQMLKEELREFTYDAEMAELDSTVSFSNFYTMNIKVNGFRDSFSTFIGTYLEKIIGFEPKDASLFENIKQKQIKNYSNALLGNPYQLAYESTLASLREGSAHSYNKKLQVIPSISLSDVQEYSKYWKTKLYSEILVSGNIDQSAAVSITKGVEQTMKQHSSTLRREDIASIRPVFLPVKQTCIVEETLTSKEDNNCSIIVHYQYEAAQTRTKILQDLALAFIKQPAFDYLRTKEQLGYIVMCLPDDNRGVLGFSILIQSNIKNSHQLTSYVDTFVGKILKEKIDQLTEEEFNQYRDSLLSTKQQKDKKLADESLRFWSEIVKHAYEFNRKEQELEALPTITVEQFKNFLNFLFFEAPRRFQIHQVAQSLKAANDESLKQRLQKDKEIRVFSDLVAFRKKMQLYPDYYSHL